MQLDLMVPLHHFWNNLMPTRAFAKNPAETIGNVHNSKPQWSSIFRRSFLPTDTSSEQSFCTLSKWLTECLQDYELCSKQPTSNLPKRVLESCEGKVYLREPRAVQARYACLSHCWGSSGAALQLKSTTLEIFKNGIEKSLLPKTFRDAVEICSKLSIQFLWIDALYKYYLPKTPWTPN